MKSNRTTSQIVAGLMLCSHIAAMAQDVAKPAPVEQPKSNAGATEVRTSDEFRGAMGTKVTREALVKKIEALIVQSNIKRQIIDELKKNFNGTAATAIPIHLFEVLLTEDFVAVVLPLAEGIEDHRYHVSNALTNSFTSLTEYKTVIDQKNVEIDSIGKSIVEGELAGRSLTPAQIESKKRVLRTLILHRKDKELAIERCRGDIDYYKGEMKELGRLESYLDGVSEELAVHIERVMDALDHERNTLITQDMRDGQELLRAAMDMLKARGTPEPEIIHTGHNAGERRSSGLGTSMDNIETSQTPLTPEEEEMVKEELLKVQTRMKNGSTKSS